MTRRTPKHATRDIEVGEETSVRIVAVADTHSRPHPRAGERIAAESPDWILHAGDVGENAVLDELAAIAPTIAVRGNIDGHGLPDSVSITFSAAGEPRLRILLTHIAVRGPRLRKDAVRQARAHGANVVVCGHSHVPLIAKDEGLTVFNPGSIGPRRFTLPIAFGVLELGPEGLRLGHVDCERGGAWLPPAA